MIDPPIPLNIRRRALEVPPMVAVKAPAPRRLSSPYLDRKHENLGSVRVFEDTPAGLVRTR